MNSKNHNEKYSIKVSVCVVSYNQEQYIVECLKSIVSQETKFKFEVLVSDDGSTDSTRDIISQYAQKYPDIVVPILRKNNIGAFNNFVETHNMARGEYVCHCDGDDRWLPGKLQGQADFLDANPDYTVVWHRMNLFYESGGFYPGELYDYSMFDDGVVTFSQSLRLGSVASHSSIMYRSSARETKNPNFETLDLYYTWEYLSKGKGKILNQVFGEYRVSSANAITRNTGSKIKGLYAHHAKLFLMKFPNQQKNIFVFSLINLLVDLKNRRSTAICFFSLAIKSLSFLKPSDFFLNLRLAKKLCIPKISDK